MRCLRPVLARSAMHRLRRGLFAPVPLALGLQAAKTSLRTARPPALVVGARLVFPFGVLVVWVFW